jgi:hypothetical protein
MVLSVPSRIKNSSKRGTPLSTGFPLNGGLAPGLIDHHYRVEESAITALKSENLPLRHV